MIVYHTIAADSLQKTLKEGLKCSSRGEKGNDTAIAKTDKFLDAHRPDTLINSHVSRDNNLYAYTADGDTIIDIVDGQKIDLKVFVEKEEQSVLQLTIDPAKCYVSDIDLFDEVKEVVEKKANAPTLTHLASRYWQNVRPLHTFSIGDMHRPEVMIPFDVHPRDIKVVS